jgi:hypothetical protein
VEEETTTRDGSKQALALSPRPFSRTAALTISKHAVSVRRTLCRSARKDAVAEFLHSGDVL